MPAATPTPIAPRTRQLLLLRHAQAEPGGKGLEDAERPLTASGRREALDAAQRIAETGLRIDEMLVSPARRTRETATLVAAQLDLPAGYRVDPALYLGEPDELLLALHHCRSTWRTVLMVGHNPGLSALASRLHGAHIELGTAGLCSIYFGDVAWCEIDAAAVRTFDLLR